MVESVQQLSEISEGLSIVLIAGPSFQAPEGLKRIAAAAAPNRRALWHRFDQAGGDLATSLADAGEEVLLLAYGLELLPDRGRVEVQIELNLLRDTLARQSALIVIWVPSEDLESFRHHCADLFQWRSALLRLEAADVGTALEIVARRRFLKSLRCELAATADGPYVEPRIAPREGPPAGLVRWATSVHRGWLIGPAGSGKTRAARQLTGAAVEFALGQEPEGGGLLPLLIPLRLIRRWPDSAAEGRLGVLAELAELPLPVSGEQLEAWGAEGRLWLILDGLDELPTDRRPKVHRWIEGLSRRYPVKILVISRPGIQVSAPWQVATVLPYSNEQVEVLVRHHLPPEPAERLLGSLRRQSRLWELARSPMLLLTLLDLARGGTLPTRRFGLFRSATSQFLIGWDQSRGLTSLRSLESPEQLRLKLGRLAFYGLERGTSAFSDTELRDVADLHGDSRNVLVERTGLLKRESSTFTLSHLSFAEYFAAEHLLSLGAPAALEHLESRVDNPQWRPVIVMTMSELIRLLGEELLWEFLWPDDSLALEMRLQRAALAFECALEAELEGNAVATHRHKALEWLAAAPAGSPERSRLQESLHWLDVRREDL